MRYGRIWILTWAMVALIARHSMATIDQGPIVSSVNGHIYYLLDTDTWTDSEAQAEALGGTLAIVRNQAENDWIFNTFRGPSPGNRHDLWIGYYDPDTGDGTGAQHAADFRWIDNEPITFTAWDAASGAPNNSPTAGGEYYGALIGFSHDGQTPDFWNDKNNDGSQNPAYGVVEVVPEPMGLGMLLLGTVGLLAHRRQRT